MNADVTNLVSSKGNQCEGARGCVCVCARGWIIIAYKKENGKQREGYENNRKMWWWGVVVVVMVDEGGLVFVYVFRFESID